MERLSPPCPASPPGGGRLTPQALLVCSAAGRGQMFGSGRKGGQVELGDFAAAFGQKAASL